ncbi:MAG: protein kinase [Deltaproteobacteria bacterium]|nr:protein kinase [Deltaproteobacteria bacterium]
MALMLGKPLGLALTALLAATPPFHRNAHPALASHAAPALVKATPAVPKPAAPAPKPAPAPRPAPASTKPTQQPVIHPPLPAVGGNPPTTDAPAPAGQPPLWLDPRVLGGGGVLIALGLGALMMRKRSKRPHLRVEIVLDTGHEGRFMAALIPEHGEPLAEALEQAMRGVPDDVLDPTIANIPANLRSVLSKAVSVRTGTSLGQVKPGTYRLVAFGRSAPQRELQMRVGGATAARSASEIRNHAMERRVVVLDRPVTVPFDFREKRAKGAHAAGTPVSTPPPGQPGPNIGGVVGPPTAGDGPRMPIMDTRSAEDYRRAREAFAAGQYELAAEIFHQVGDREQEARCYLFGGHPERVARIDAELAEARGEKALAINHYLRAKDTEAAARLLRELGRDKEALHLRAQERLDSGDAHGALELFEQAGDDTRAAELLETEGQHAKALEMYERAKAWEPAARLASRMGDTERAATDFEKANLPSEASVFRLRLGQTEAARKLADSVPPGTPGELLALTVLARLWQAEGREPELRTLAGRAVSAGLSGNTDRDALRALALFYKQLGLREPAHALFSRLAATDPTDLDAADAASALQGSLPVAMPAGAANATLAAFDHKATMVPRIATGATGKVNARPASSGAALPPGNQRYKLDAELGRGAMGVVYRGTDQLLGRPVAIKMLPSEFSRNDQLRRLFLDEARALAALNHPHVVQVYDLGEMDGSLFLAMELVEGETLESVLSRAQLPLPRALDVLDQLAQALEAAHGRGIVHRDVKPGNVMVTPGGAVKLMDFGIAAGGGVGSQAPTRVGTPRYMAPEQIRGEASDARADLYALGVLAFQLCTGQLPFPDDGVLDHHLQTAPPRAATLRPELAGVVDELVARLLSKPRDERPKNATEVRAALAPALVRAA